MEMVREQKYIPCIGRDHSRQLEEDLEAFSMLCCRNCLRGLSYELWIEVWRFIGSGS